MQAPFILIRAQKEGGGGDFPRQHLILQGLAPLKVSSGTQLCAFTPVLYLSTAAIQMYFYCAGFYSLHHRKESCTLSLQTSPLVAQIKWADSKSSIFLSSWAKLKINPPTFRLISIIFLWINLRAAVLLLTEASRVEHYKCFSRCFDHLQG